ncbi:MAG TPA: PA14 domain-containing protein, partial [Cytophagales bacterium]
VNGTNTDDIPVNTTPTSTSILTSLEGPTNVADNYGARIRALLKPTVSGDYTFYLASDDYSKLLLSNNAQPAGKTLIASVASWTNSREWTKLASQKSAAISLVAGQEYYLEILHKEGNGGDNVAVGWTGPGISTITVIGAPYIRQYVPDPNAPTPPAAPTNLVASNVTPTGFTVSWNASTGTVASYNVYTGTTLAGNTTTTSFALTGLAAATAYAVTVKAVAPDGTLSAASPVLNATTAPAGPSTGQKSLDLSFTDPADADRFAFIIDTGGESVKTVQNGVMKLVINKKEWHFYQVYIDPFDFIGNPYVSFKIKVDQATPIRMWIKKGEGNANEKELYNQTLQASADFQTINLHFTDLTPLVGDMAEIGIDIGGYQPPPAVFAGTAYLDYFRVGEAAKPATPDPSTGDKSLNLSFTDPTDADRFNFVIDTGGESVKTVQNGVMKLVVNKLSWHFYQLLIDPFDFIGNPYVSFKIKVDQATPIRMWIKRGIDTGIEKELFNQTIQPSADFQVIQLSYTYLTPLEGDMTELGIDIGGYQAAEGSRFAGTVYLDYFRLGEAAKPGVIVDRDEVPPTAPANLLTSAVTTGGFTLNWAPATDNVGVTAYKVYANEALVATTPATTLNAQVTGLNAGTAYAVKVVAEDAAGNTTPSGTITVTTAAPAPVTLTREVWRNLTGKGIASIPVNTPPTATTQLTRLEGPADAGDNFGARIRAYITPAVSGYYTFYVAADDVAELWLSINDNPAQKTRIAQVTKAVKPGEWNKVSGQKSTEKLLLEGVRYYVEVLHRETTGKDFVSVGWTGP